MAGHRRCYKPSVVARPRPQEPKQRGRKMWISLKMVVVMIVVSLFEFFANNVPKKKQPKLMHATAPPIPQREDGEWEQPIRSLRLLALGFFDPSGPEVFFFCFSCHECSDQGRHSSVGRWCWGGFDLRRVDRPVCAARRLRGTSAARERDRGGE